MTKIDIVEKIIDQIGIPKKDSVEIVESVLSILKSTLEAGEDVMISGFGKFEVKQKNDRKGRNPATGDSMILEARRVVTFKPSTILKTAINMQN